MKNESTLARESCGVYTARSLAHIILRGADCAIVAAGALGVLYFVPVFLGVELSLPLRLALALLVPLVLMLTTLLLIAHFTPRRFNLFETSWPRRLFLSLAIIGPTVFLLLCGVQGETQREEDLKAFEQKYQTAQREIELTRERLSAFVDICLDTLDPGKVRMDPPAARKLAVTFMERVHSHRLNDKLYSLEKELDDRLSAFRKHPIRGDENWMFVTIRVPDECADQRENIHKWKNEVDIAKDTPPDPAKVEFDEIDIKSGIETLQGLVNDAILLGAESGFYVNGDVIYKEIEAITDEALHFITSVNKELSDAKREYENSIMTQNSKLEALRKQRLKPLYEMVGVLESSIKQWTTRLIASVRKGVDQIPIDRKPWANARVRALRTIEEAQKLSNKASEVKKSAMMEEIDTKWGEWQSRLGEQTAEFNRQFAVWSESNEIDRNAQRQIEEVTPSNLTASVDEWLKQNDDWRKQLDIRHSTRRLESRHAGYWLRVLFTFGLGAQRRMETVWKDHEDAFKAGKTPDTAVLEQMMNEAKSPAEKMLQVDSSLANAERATIEGRITKDQLDEFRTRVNDLKRGIELPEIQRNVILTAEQGYDCDTMRSLLTGIAASDDKRIFWNKLEKDLVREALHIVGVAATIKYWNQCLATVPIQQ